METGIVKFFDARPGKLFGRIIDESGNEIWFHYSSGREFLLMVNGDVKHSSLPGRIAFPKQGDRVVFLRGSNAQGPKATPWGFKAAYDLLVKEADARKEPKEVPERHLAAVFDLPVDGPDHRHGVGHSPDAIGGCYGIGWWSYFKDTTTGEVYRVYCSDGVNGGRGPYSSKDEGYRYDCYRAMIERFRSAAERKASEIRISRNERAVIQGYTHATLFETGDNRRDGEQSNKGLEGGLVGYFHGIPVICDVVLFDNLPLREEDPIEAKSAASR